MYSSSGRSGTSFGRVTNWAAGEAYGARVDVRGGLRRHSDVLLAVLVATGFLVELVVGGDLAADVEAVPLVFLASLPLALRRRAPLAAFLAVWAGLLGLMQVVGSTDDASATFLVVFAVSLYSLGAYAAGREAWAAGCLIPIGIALFVANDGDQFMVGDVLFGTLLVGGPWAAGVAMRFRREREQALARRAADLQQAQEELARQEVAAERARIARELHDVVSHAISVTVLQARGGRRVLGSDVTRAREAFDAIAQTNERALGDMRRLLAVLDDADGADAHGPPPSLDGLESLARQVESSGLAVQIEICGERRTLAPGVDLSAYRIVQEALTNVLKHAGPARVQVRIDYRRDDLVVSVLDDGNAAQSADATSAGRGLVGIHERVAALGGDVEAGPGSTGGFAVRARLPYSVES